MCQINESPIRHTHKDHIVYKLVYNQILVDYYFSLFWQTRYRLGSLYKQSSESLQYGVNSDTQPGFHFFTSFKSAHRYKSYYACRCEILKCRIPAGSVYRTGDMYEHKRKYKTLRTNQFTPIEEIK